MKNLLLTIALLVTALCQAQIDFSSKTLMGEVTPNGPVLLIEESTLVTEINNNFGSNVTQLEKCEIVKGVTMGEKEEEFYYIKFTTSITNKTLVKYLFNYNGKLYIDPVNETESYQYSYVSCEGVEDCKPHLFVIDGEKGWTCGTSLVCVAEVTEENKCIKSSSIFISE